LHHSHFEIKADWAKRVVIDTKSGEVGNQLNGYILQTFHYSKYIKQPYYKNNYNNCIQYIFNGTLHGNVTIYQPEYNTGDNNDDKNS